MKNHTKVYLEGMGYDISDWIPCEICENEAKDIHHIEGRGRLGSSGTTDSDTLDNLMALCREHHIEYGDITDLIPMLKKIHLKRMELRNTSGGIMDPPHEV